MSKYFIYPISLCSTPKRIPIDPPDATTVTAVAPTLVTLGTVLTISVTIGKFARQVPSERYGVLPEQLVHVVAVPLQVVHGKEQSIQELTNHSFRE